MSQFPELSNDLLLRAARGEKTERSPVWLMRQAGRILPEYRKVRASLSGFIQLVKTPELAAEVTIQPVDALGVDAAIIFSDILVIPEAMGLPYRMVEGKGPRFPATISSAADLTRLHRAEAQDLNYVLEALTLTRHELAGRVPLIGFAGAPWTIFCYMVEGQGSKTFSKARAMLAEEPNLAHQLLQMITDSTITYLQAQVSAGAQLLQLFDSWAGILGPEQYRSFALPYVRQICQALDEVPFTVFAKGAWFALEDFAALPCETVGLDWHTPIDYARRALPNKCLQGNLDPAVLYGSPQSIRQATEKMLSAFHGQAHIANLGHGVYPDIDPQRVKVFVDTVKSWTPKGNLG